MRYFKFIPFFLLLALTGVGPANAHQPVLLQNTDTTANKGPLLVDGTVSFAVRVTFTKSGQTRGFRAGFREGDRLALQYLIVDKQPENSLISAKLPKVSIISPSGKKWEMKINERTPFFEPFGRTNYFYLSRFVEVAEAGTYSLLITSRSKAAITLAIGENEIPGVVTRGGLG